jgi:hypothetical protein
MKEFNLEEYNELCADFMGMKYASKRRFNKDTGWVYSVRALDMFNSDWNWIMEVKSKICTLDIVDEFNTSYDSVEKGFSCTVLPTFKNTFNSFRTVVFDDEKQAIVQAIWEFLNWYKESKQ